MRQYGLYTHEVSLAWAIWKIPHPEHFLDVFLLASVGDAEMACPLPTFPVLIMQMSRSLLDR